uniref:Odorant-binding protein 30 n=1 Tax=Matsumurasca onukii TaxID=2912585 RepID=A0A343WGY6_MATON|nr:odorant-binding protein 30 [Matsumurasca onukii]
MMWLRTLLALGALSTTLAEDQCEPQPGGVLMECCKLGDLLFPPSIDSSATSCRKKLPPLNPSNWTQSAKNAHACLVECIFAEEGILTQEKKVDKEVAVKYFTSSNSSLTSMVKTAVEKCIQSYEADVDQTLHCKSGAGELKDCFLLEYFLDCPSASYNPSPKCDEFKSKVKKCPGMRSSQR